MSGFRVRDPAQSKADGTPLKPTRLSMTPEQPGLKVSTHCLRTLWTQQPCGGPYQMGQWNPAACCLCILQRQAHMNVCTSADTRPAC